MIYLVILFFPHVFNLGQAFPKTYINETFDSKNIKWEYNKKSWNKVSYKDIKKNFTSFTDPKSGSKHGLLLTNKQTFSYLIYNLTIPDGKFELETIFSCLIVGNKTNTTVVPSLNVLYSGVKVFDYNEIKEESSDQIMTNNWNNFRITSKYTTPEIIEISFAGHSGTVDDSIVLLDNINITVSEYKVKPFFNPEEPQASLEEKGIWEKISLLDLFRSSGSNNRPYYCSLPFEHGPCRAVWFRYYFNPSTEKCETFTFGGCDGNNNNFHTKEFCESTCLTKVPADNITTTAQKVNSIFEGFEGSIGSTWKFERFKFVKLDQKTGKLNSSSIYGLSPSDSRLRSMLLHDLDLLEKSRLSISFALKFIRPKTRGNDSFFNFDSPGFKIYVGNFLLFDLATSGKVDLKWHNYTCFKHTDSILNRHNGKKSHQILIEAWDPYEYSDSRLIFDDLNIYQNPVFLDICKLPKDSGSCTKTFHRYYYDSILEKCLPFIYSGCKGNMNHFINLYDCVSRCGGNYNNSPITQSTKRIATTETKSNLLDCKQPRKYGNCSENHLVYGFNGKECSQYTFSGCGGTKNNFPTLKECKTVCEPSCSSAQTRVSCTPESDVEDFRYKNGICFSRMRKCPKFGYVIAEFTSMNKCEDLCQSKKKPNVTDICVKIIKPGYCSDSVYRYFYNSSTNNCERIINGTCDSDDFTSIKRCNHRCQIPCSTPKAITNCVSNQNKGFYFDVLKGKCFENPPGKCFGNFKTFITKVLCDKSCGVNETVVILNRNSDSFGGPTIAEIVIGVLLTIFMFLGVWLGIYYYRVHSENYRIFENERRNTVDLTFDNMAYSQEPQASGQES